MRSPSAPSIEHDLVLVGGGHAHIQVLKRWAMAPVPGARLTLVVDRPIAVYSGMVPGFVAGQYSRDALEIDVRPLALRAGARCIVAAATGVDPTARRLILDGRPPITYDTVSFDVGSTIAGLEIPGARAHAIPTRPIGEFVRRVGEVLAAARGRESFRVPVVGAASGGVEVAFALPPRLRPEPGRPARLARRGGGAARPNGGAAAEGTALFSLKAWVGRRFVRRFQVLGPDDAVTPDFAASPMPGGEMLCGGCAAKVGESALTRALERLAPPSHPSVILGLTPPPHAAAGETQRGGVVAPPLPPLPALA